MLGHANASMTLNVYFDLFDDDLDVVAARLNAAIQSAAYCLSTGGESVAHAERNSSFDLLKGGGAKGIRTRV
jgi:hypothetical protein